MRGDELDAPPRRGCLVSNFPPCWRFFQLHPPCPSAPGVGLRFRFRAGTRLPLTLRREKKSTLGRRFAFGRWRGAERSA